MSSSRLKFPSASVVPADVSETLISAVKIYVATSIDLPHRCQRVPTAKKAARVLQTVNRFIGCCRHPDNNSLSALGRRVAQSSRWSEP